MRIGDGIIHDLADGDNAAPDREIDVLRLIALGHTHPEIAQMLHVSQRTVEAHRASLTTKLQSRNRADLVRAAMEMRLVEFG